MKTFYLYITFLVFATRKWAQSATTQEIKEWVDGHNWRRLEVAKGEVRGQPSASEMNAVIWNQELYKKAQAYADTHPYSHNPDRTVPSGRFRTGENYYRMKVNNHNYKLSPNTVLEDWYGEHVNYTYGPQRKRYPSEPIVGHYTQIVWSNSTDVGCGISEAYEGFWKIFYVICNYGPAGNVLGETPYNKGGPVDALTCTCGEECDYCEDIYGGGN